MAELLKNRYNETFFDLLIEDFQKHKPDFKAADFKAFVFDEEWAARELKDRMRHISLSLHQYLNLPFADAIALFKLVIAERSGESFEKMFFPDYVELFGLDHLHLSLDALAYFTPFASSEFAIRPFIKRYETEAMQKMMDWATDANFHVRRLASEGCRPRLPWAMALPAFKQDPSLVLPILELLKDDPEEYVRRSVANNLNDIAKDNPAVTLQIAENWYGKNPERDWIVKHACRSLLKQANTRALILFGFASPSAITISQLAIDKPTLSIGDSFTFSFCLSNNDQKSNKLRVEYIIDFMKKNGKTSPKVFQITERVFAPGEHLFTKAQSFKDLSTRRHHPGSHQLRIVVNGTEKARLGFELNLA